MEDLSYLFPDGPVAALVPSSQHSGNRPADQSAARSAPGTESPSVDEADIHRGPYASAIDHQRSVLKDGHDTGLDGGKPTLRMGQWNDMRGSDA